MLQARYLRVFYVSCQFSETLLSSAIAPVVVDGQVGFIYHKNVECISVEVYNVFTAILLNNISNFKEICHVSFQDMVKYSFSLKDIDFSDNFHLFVINKNVQCNSEGYHQEVDGHIVKYKYIVEPT